MHSPLSFFLQSKTAQEYAVFGDKHICWAGACLLLCARKNALPRPTVSPARKKKKVVQANKGTAAAAAAALLLVKPSWLVFGLSNCILWYG